MKRGYFTIFLTTLLALFTLAGAVWAAEPEPLQEEAHAPYIHGRSAGIFAPNAPLTRAETASMLDALLDTEAAAADFLDVAEDAWYADAVGRLAAGGVLGGYPDGDFRPQAAITRAEFVTVLTRIFPAEGDGAAFADVPEGYWASEAVSAAAGQGWIRGYADGTFRPDCSITRAEAVTVLNAALGRAPDADLQTSGIRPFADVRPADWFYAAVTEASTDHEFAWEDEGESWTDFTWPDSGLTPGLSQAGGSLYQVDENRQITALPAGFQTLDGKTYYVSADGGIPFPGEGPFQLDGQLYCRRADGSLVIGEQYGVLTFDAAGRYTCGDAALDAKIQSLLATCTDPSTSREQQLRAAYNYLRDNCRYLSRAHHPRGSLDWLPESANFWLENRKGNCYCFAAMFYYMARQLGFQASAVSGGIGANNADHAWVMIDGRIYDPEYESQMWTVRRLRRDLCGVLPQNAPFVYHFPEG